MLEMRSTLPVLCKNEEFFFFQFWKFHHGVSMFYFRCHQHEHITQKRITVPLLGFFGERIIIYLLLEELMLADAGVGKVAGQLKELMLAEAGVGEVARLLVEEGMVLALLATIEMKTEDQ